MFKVNQLNGFNAGGKGPPASFIFNGTDEYLTNTIVSSAPNQQKFSVSLWGKWTTLPSNVSDVMWVTGTSGVTTNRCSCFPTDSLSIKQIIFISVLSGTTQCQTASPQVTMATNTWYHFLWSVDTTQAVALDRVDIAFNGTDTGAQHDTTPAQNANFRFFANGDVARIGSNQSGGSLMNGRIAFVQVIEGTKVAISDVTVNDGGTLKHKPYGGSYGTHGLYMDGVNGFTDAIRSLEFTGVNMDITANRDFADLPPYVSW